MQPKRTTMHQANIARANRQQSPERLLRTAVSWEPHPTVVPELPPGVVEEPYDKALLRRSSRDVSLGFMNWFRAKRLRGKGKAVTLQCYVDVLIRCVGMRK